MNIVRSKKMTEPKSGRVLMTETLHYIELHPINKKVSGLQSGSKGVFQMSKRVIDALAWF